MMTATNADPFADLPHRCEQPDMYAQSLFDFNPRSCMWRAEQMEGIYGKQAGARAFYQEVQRVLFSLLTKSYARDARETFGDDAMADVKKSYDEAVAQNNAERAKFFREVGYAVKRLNEQANNSQGK